jgi:hypothetical protein
MADRDILRGLGRRGVAALYPHLALAVLALLAAAPIALAAALMPRAAVLPALSLAALALAGVLGGIAWWRKASRHAASVTLWDAAGACVLIGCAAAMLSQPENLLQVFASTHRP